MGKTKVSVTRVSDIRYMPLSETTLYIEWSGSHLNKASGYTVTWEVWIRGGDRWYAKESQSVSGRKNTTWDVPTEAISVRATVKASGVTNTKSYEVGRSKRTNEFRVAYLPKVTKPTLQTPTIENGKLKLRVENYSDTYGAVLMYFEVSANDGAARHVGTARYNAQTGVAALDCGVSNGNRYKARVKALTPNAGLNRDSDFTDFTSNIYTPPVKVAVFNQPEALKAEDGTRSVKLSWGAVANVVTYKIDYTTDKTHFDTESDDVYHDQTETNVTSRIITSNIEPGHEYFFRVRGTNSANPGDGPWSAIRQVIIGTKPNPPTIWTYETVFKIGDVVTLCFTHNSADSSKMTAAQIAWRVDGDPTQHIEWFTPPEDDDPTKPRNTFDFSFDTSALPDGAKVYWKAQTKGIVDEMGDYSAEKFFSVYTAPEITVSVGDSYEWEDTNISQYHRVDSYPLQILTQSTPQTQSPIALILSVMSEDDYDISMADGTEIHVARGETIWEKYYTVSEHEITTVLNAGDIFLNNGTKYALNASVTMSNGLSATGTCLFITDWEDADYELNADTAIDDVNLAAMINAYAEDQYGIRILDGLLLSVYRRDVDGSFTEIATNLDVADNVTVTDIHPALDYARYRIVGISKNTGMVSFADLEGEPIGYKGIVIQWSEGWQEVDEGLPDFDTTVEYLQEARVGSILKLPYNVDVSDNPGKDVSMVAYAGRSYPVSFYGTAKTMTSTWSTEVPKSDTATMHAVRRLANYQGNCYVREPNGTGYWAVVTISYSYTHNSPLVPVNLSISRVEGGA